MACSLEVCFVKASSLPRGFARRDPHESTDQWQLCSLSRHGPGDSARDVGRVAPEDAKVEKQEGDVLAGATIEVGGHLATTSLGTVPSSWVPQFSWAHLVTSPVRRS